MAKRVYKKGHPVVTLAPIVMLAKARAQGHRTNPAILRPTNLKQLPAPAD